MRKCDLVLCFDLLPLYCEVRIPAPSLDLFEQTEITNPLVLTAKSLSEQFSQQWVSLNNPLPLAQARRNVAELARK